MSAGLFGMVLGLVAGSGLLLAVSYAPPFQQVRLVDRLAPYVHDTPAPSRLLGTATQPGLLAAARRVFGPALSEGAHHVDRLLGGRIAVRRRLDALALEFSVEDFRVEQVVWGGLGLLGGAVVTVVSSALAGSVNVLSAVLVCVAGLVGGVLGRDWWLTQQVQRREELLLAEFPVVAELLALAVTAGESPTAAIARVTRLSGGELARELGATLGRARAGVPLVEALQQLADRTSLDALARFVDGLIVAIERGTPLAEVLRAQAADVREAGKRRLLEAGGRKEIAMMLATVMAYLSHKRKAAPPGAPTPNGALIPHPSPRRTRAPGRSYSTRRRTRDPHRGPVEHPSDREPQGSDDDHHGHRGVVRGIFL